MLVFNKEVNNPVFNKNNGSHDQQARKNLHTHTHNTLSHTWILNRRQKHRSIIFKNQSIFNNDYLSGSCAATSFFFSSVQFSRSVVSDSLRPHESQHVLCIFTLEWRRKCWGRGEGRVSLQHSRHMNYQVWRDVPPYLPGGKTYEKRFTWHVFNYGFSFSFV